MPALPTRRLPAITAAILGAVALAAGPARPLGAQPAAAPTHAYHLNGSFADALGGPSLVGLGGTLGATGYTFGLGQGLSLSHAVNPSVYAIEMAFRLDDVSWFRKVLDLNDRRSDFGFYVQNGYADFGGGSGNDDLVPEFSAHTPAHLVLTRDADRRFTAYVNGVQALSFVDNAGTATFTGPGGVAYLFQDDLQSAGAHHSSGFLDYLRVYDRALTGVEVVDRFARGDDALPGEGPVTPPTSTVPEPGTWALVGTGLAGVLGAARRRAAA